MRSQLRCVLFLASLACLRVSTAAADDGDVIDQCSLDGNDVLHCSTPNRRDAHIDKILMQNIRGYDIDERQQYVGAVASAWLDRQREPCQSAGISIQNVFNAYNAPGTDNGVHIAELEDPCERAFATWLFKKENHGMPPGQVAHVNTMVLEDISWAHDESRGCPKEASGVIRAARAWLAAEKALDAAKRRATPSKSAATRAAEDALEAANAAENALDPAKPKSPFLEAAKRKAAASKAEATRAAEESFEAARREEASSTSEATSAAEQKAQESWDERQTAVRTLNTCVDAQ